MTSLLDIAVQAPREEIPLFGKRYVSYEVVTNIAQDASDPSQKRNVTVRRRYRDFETLSKNVLRLLSRDARTDFPKLPPKNYLHRFEHRIVEARMAAFQAIVDAVLRIPALLSRPFLQEFVGISGLLTKRVLIEHARQIAGMPARRIARSSDDQHRRMLQPIVEEEEGGELSAEIAAVLQHPLLVARQAQITDEETRAEIRFFVEECFRKVDLRVELEEAFDEIQQREIVALAEIAKVRDVIVLREQETKSAMVQLNQDEMEWTRRTSFELDSDRSSRVDETVKRLREDTEESFQRKLERVSQELHSEWTLVAQSLQEESKQRLSIALDSERQRLSALLEEHKQEIERREQESKKQVDAFAMAQSRWEEDKHAEEEKLNSTLQREIDRIQEEVNRERVTILSEGRQRIQQIEQQGTSEHDSRSTEMTKQFDALTRSRSQWEREKKELEDDLKRKLKNSISQRVIQLSKQMEGFKRTKWHTEEHLAELRVQFEGEAREALSAQLIAVKKTQDELEMLKKESIAELGLGVRNEYDPDDFGDL